MGTKRKRTATDSSPIKRIKPAHHPVLSVYYPRITTLRSYLLELLPASSKSRRRKVASVTSQCDAENHHQQDDEDDCASSLAHLLDTTLVGVLKQPDHGVNRSRQRDFAAFTQSQDRSTSGSADAAPTSSQGEIVDFAISSLFNRHQGSFPRPSHLLCHGFQRATNHCLPNQEHGPMAGIRGIVPQYPNKNVSLLKNFPWTDILGLLGRSCEDIMLHLLLDCVPLVDLPLLNQCQAHKAAADDGRPKVKNPAPQSKQQIQSPSNIVFVRRRMFYARAALNAKGQVRFGLRHIHVLNRYPESTNLDHTVQIMKYIFPRQFGLHNAFTSSVDRRETIQPFKDYTLREEEIAKSENLRRLHMGNPSSYKPNKLPKRLRGQAVSLIQNLQKRHRNCAYVELLRHYCPVDKAIPSTKCSMMEFATPAVAVSAFCRAVLLRLIPNELYGCGDDGVSNRENVLRHVDVFIGLGRFENMSLHEVSQGLKVTCIKWLQPPQKTESQSEPSNGALSDIRKRTEIFLEFIYYIFDSLLIPLIRSNFYVTETGVLRNRVFYFRHDVWRKLAEPSISQLKTSVFEEVKKDKAERILARRSLGFSNLRLVPKAAGARPIVNLRKRQPKRNARGRGTELGSSINSLMVPVYSVLNYERDRRPQVLESALSSAQEIYSRLKAFKEKMIQRGTMGKKPFYFVKLDVQSCFDTIPQKRLIQLIDRLVREDAYRVTKHAQVTPSVGANSGLDKSNIHRVGKAEKPRRKFVSRAAASSDFVTAYDLITRDCANTAPKNNTVFVDIGAQKHHDTHDLLELLEHHIRVNLVKIGKKYFRQKNGIPQGSVVSALLCSFFYGQHEKAELGFLRDYDEAILLRFIDDYLFVTTDKSLALRFLRVMLDGNTDYGISVSPDKTLVNFEATVGEYKIPRLPTSQFAFPYCGTLIDTRTLALSRDRQHQRETAGGGGTTNTNDLRVSDTLTVETTRTPGQAFHRKTLTTFRFQLHTMFLDTKHNSTPVALRSLYQSFVETAMKTYVYQRRLLSRPGRKQRDQRHKKTESSRDTSAQLLMRIIADLIRLAIHIVRARNSSLSSSSSTSADAPAKSSGVKFEYTITPSQVTWLAAMAFKFVLSRKQTGFTDTLGWLDGVARTSKPKTDGEAARLWSVVQGAGSVMKGLRF